MVLSTYLGLLILADTFLIQPLVNLPTNSTRFILLRMMMMMMCVCVCVFVCLCVCGWLPVLNFHWNSTTSQKRNYSCVSVCWLCKNYKKTINEEPSMKNGLNCRKISIFCVVCEKSNYLMCATNKITHTKRVPYFFWLV